MRRVPAVKRDVMMEMRNLRDGRTEGSKELLVYLFVSASKRVPVRSGEQRHKRHAAFDVVPLPRLILNRIFVWNIEL